MTMKSFAVVCAAAVLATAAVNGGAALADVGPKDIQIAAKTIGFTAPPMSGTLKVAIVYDAGVPQSQKDSDDLKSILGTGLAAGQATLVPVLVPVGQIDSGLEGANLVFVTGGLAAQQDRIFAVTKAKKLLSVSTDTSCVQSGRCVMGVRSDPKVEILISKAAAESSSISFAPAFRMMITEL